MDLILSVEEARRARRMSQTQVAEALKITQGHYSKVVAARVALSASLAERMESWLLEGGRTPLGDEATRRIHSLAASIRRECMELMQLVGLAEVAEL
jgi:transcriptional regulator with XRE-family HTH domain